MNKYPGLMLAALLISVSQTGCTSNRSEPNASGEDASIVGWYVEHAGQAMLQPCDQGDPLNISWSSELTEKARSFGLTDGNPVYVRIKGEISGDTLAVSKVEQFGSPEPVTNCAMTGMVVPDGK
jgi:hypothetical protein